MKILSRILLVAGTGLAGLLASNNAAEAKPEVVLSGEPLTEAVTSSSSHGTFDDFTGVLGVAIKGKKAPKYCIGTTNSQWGLVKAALLVNAEKNDGDNENIILYGDYKSDGFFYFTRVCANHKCLDLIKK